MRGDIALVGFVLTAEEWQALDPLSRAQLLEAAFQREAPWIMAPLAELLSQPRVDDEPR
ncbi:MAG: hypothetical protein H6Q90_5391 [Deltaproteobacteria bacterium]|nr:hypothetical protein [Deltaproteobacteria bacterium]